MIGYRCPLCGRALVRRDAGLLCPHDGYRNEPTDGIRDFLSPDELGSHVAFIEEYRSIRAGEGRGDENAEHYLGLPSVPGDHPRQGEWALRAQSMRWLEDWLSREGRPGALTILDAGAGNCWLARHLAEWGHAVVALDLNTDERDGLLAGRHYLARLPISFERVRADFGRLPFTDDTFDLVVFNGAVHYAPDVSPALAEARRVTVPGGAIVIIDSPIYVDAASGMKMRAERAIEGRAGFLTFDGLRRMAAELGLDLVIDLPDVGLLRRIKRRLTEFRKGREIARMGRILLKIEE